MSHSVSQHANRPIAQYFQQYKQGCSTREDKAGAVRDPKKNQIRAGWSTVPQHSNRAGKTVIGIGNRV